MQQTPQNTQTPQEYSPEMNEQSGFGTEFQDQTNSFPMNSGAILQQQHLEEVILKIRGSLEGVRWDENLQQYVQASPPLLSKKGIEGVMRFLESYLHRGTFLSNLDEDNVSKLMIQISHTITEMLILNYYTWEIDKTNLSQIADIIEHNIFCALKRAYGAGDKKYFGNIQQMRTVESHSYLPPQEQKKGMLNTVGGLFKG